MKIVMSIKYVTSALAVASCLAFGIASAQTTAAPITVNSTPMTSPVAPGTNGATIGTFQFSGGPSGTSQVGSLPVTLATTGGGNAADLSNCAVYNASGTQISGSLTSVQSGSNTFTFSPSLAYTPNGTQTYTLRCNVAGNASTGALYQVSAGTPVYAGSLMVGFTPLSSVAANGGASTLGLVTLDASHSANNVTVSSIPFTVSYGSGASSANVTNCSLQNVSSLGTPINTGGNAVGTLGSSTTFTPDTAITVPAGTVQHYALICSVGAAMPSGSTFTVGLAANSVGASDASGSVIASPILGSNGSALPTSGTITVGSASTVPGIPNTGAGAEAVLNIALLAVSALVAAGSALFIARTSRKLRVH
jgi:hypothetical protein